MRLHARTRARLVPAFLAAAALATTAMVADLSPLKVTPDSKANAESGRRLCYYVEHLGDQVASAKAPSDGPAGTTTANVKANLTVALDYKKDGKCPDVYSLVINGKEIQLTYPDTTPGVEQPKGDCEDVYTRIGAAKGAYRGPTFDWNKPTDPGNPSLKLTPNSADPRSGTDVCTMMDDDVLYAFWTFEQKARIQVDGANVDAAPGDFMTTRLWHTER